MIPGILFFLLISIILFIFFIISLPYHYQFSFEYKDNLHLETQVDNIIFKIKYINLKDKTSTIVNILNFQKKINKDKNKKIYKNKDKKADKKSRKGFPFKIITVDNINHLLNFINNILKLIKPYYSNINLLISLEDPYYNGLILSYYHSIKSVYPNLPVQITVNWEEEVIEGQGKIVGKIVPIFVIYSLIIFILSPQTIKILWHVYKHNR